MRISRLGLGLGVAGLALSLTLGAMADETADREAKMAKQREKTAKHFEKLGKKSGKPALSQEERQKRAAEKIAKSRGVVASRTPVESGLEPKDKEQRHKEKIKASQAKREQAKKDAQTAGAPGPDMPAEDKARKGMKPKHADDGVDKQYQEVPKDESARPKMKHTPVPYKEIPKQ